LSLKYFSKFVQRPRPSVAHWSDLIRPFPFQRAASPEEIAGMVALLASDRSAYTTGTVVTIDGDMANAGTPI